MRRIFVLVCLLAVVPAGQSLACLWDSETLAQEREKFPGTLELITGKFLRHSTPYYQWRLADRLKKISADPENDALLDDIAVSYEKLGQFDEAIDVARQQLERNPDRYESLANLGTFLIHAGRYQEGLEFIERALEVNPDAHFGREKYQRELVRFLLNKFPDGKVTLPLARPGEHPFSRFLTDELSGGEREYLNAEELKEAIRGVSGMMRFSKHDHPILLDVLGQLLVVQYDPEIDAKQLAARSFFMASNVVDDAETKKAYRALAADAISMQVPRPGSATPIKPGEIERQFKAELESAERWFEELRRNEERWIKSGADVEAKFAEEYRGEPEIVPADQGAPPPVAGSRINQKMIRIAAVVCLAIAGCLYLLRKWLLRRIDPRPTAYETSSQRGS